MLLYSLKLQEELIKVFNKTAAKRFGYLEKLLLKNKLGKGWFVGEKVR